MSFSWTGSADRTLRRAQVEAEQMHHEYIGTEHILLALLQESEGSASTILTNLGVDRAAISQTTAGVVSRGEPRNSARDLPYTSRAQKVLEIARNESTQMGHADVGAEHILVGLLAEGKGVGAQVLLHAGVKLDTLRSEVIQLR
jgi:ATP-dependent Clp protease ATP-binding subunit ClpC